MPNITFLESGTDATGDFAFFTSTSGTVATDATVYKTGTRSIKCSTGSPAATALAARTGVCSDAGTRISVWVRLDTIPASTGGFFHISDASGNSVIIGFSVLSSGKIRMSAIGAVNKDSTATVSANTWFRLSCAYTITNSTTYRADFFIDGVLQGSATTGTLSLTGTGSIKPRTSTDFGANANAWFDNIYVDDGADYSDPGDIRVTAKRPAANNTNNFDTAIGANPANRWTNVNEVPLSTTNGWRHNATTDVQENYTLETAAVGDVNIAAYPRIGTTAWIWAKGTAGGAGTPKIMANGSESAITLTSAGKLFTVITTTTAYPNNAAGIGMRSTNNADDTFLYECGTLIAYTNLAAISGSVASVTSSSTTPNLALKASGSCVSASAITGSNKSGLRTSGSCVSTSSSAGTNKVGLRETGALTSASTISGSDRAGFSQSGACSAAASSATSVRLDLLWSGSAASTTDAGASSRIGLRFSADSASDTTVDASKRLGLLITGDTSADATAESAARLALYVDGIVTVIDIGAGIEDSGAAVTGDCVVVAIAEATSIVSLRFGGVVVVTTEAEANELQAKKMQGGRRSRFQQPYIEQPVPSYKGDDEEAIMLLAAAFSEIVICQN